MSEGAKAKRRIQDLIPDIEDTNEYPNILV